MINQVSTIRQRNKRLEAGVLLLLFMVFVYPFIVMPGPVPYQYIALIFISMLAVVLLFKKGFMLHKAAWLPLVAFIFMLILSTLFSDNIIRAWAGSSMRLTGTSTYLLCAVLFVLAAQSQARQQIIYAMVTAASVVSVIAIMQHYGINIVPHGYLQEMFHSYGTLGHPNFLGSYTVFILPAAMMLYLYKNQPQWLICSALIFAALLASLTRGAWLAFAAIMLLFIYYVFKNSQLRIRMLVIISVFFLVYLFFNYDSGSLFTERTSSIPAEIESVPGYAQSVPIEAISSVEIRVFVWREALKVLADNWAFGVGPDNLRIHVPVGYFEDKAFNIFLEIAVTMGIFALISYLVLIYFCLKQNKGWFGTMLSLMIIAYLLQGQFNIDVVMNLPLFWIVLGLTWADQDSIVQ